VGGGLNHQEQKAGGGLNHQDPPPGFYALLLPCQQ
jgi:hypothetical protein